MKQVEIKLMVDLDEASQVKALVDFFAAMGNPAAIQDSKKSVPAAKKEKEPVKTPIAETVVEKVPAVETKTETEPEVESTIKIEKLRELLGKKVNDHRPEIKTKLTELGSNNVSNLESVHYEEFYSFLSQLK